MLFASLSEAGDLLVFNLNVKEDLTNFDIDIDMFLMKNIKVVTVAEDSREALDFRKTN